MQPEDIHPTNFCNASPEERIPRILSLAKYPFRAIADGTMNPDELRKSILYDGMPNEELRFSSIEGNCRGSLMRQSQKKIGRMIPVPAAAGRNIKKCCGR
jgi:hypothetical protein